MHWEFFLIWKVGVMGSRTLDKGSPKTRERVNDNFVYLMSWIIFKGMKECLHSFPLCYSANLNIKAVLPLDFKIAVIAPAITLTCEYYRICRV